MLCRLARARACPRHERGSAQLPRLAFPGSAGATGSVDRRPRGPAGPPVKPTGHPRPAEPASRPRVPFPALDETGSGARRRTRGGRRDEENRGRLRPGPRSIQSSRTGDRIHMRRPADAFELIQLAFPAPFWYVLGYAPRSCRRPRLDDCSNDSVSRRSARQAFRRRGSLWGGP